MKAILLAMLVFVGCDRVSEEVDKYVAKETTRIESRVTEDAYRQLLSAMSTHDLVQICVHAGLYTASVIQAKLDARVASGF